MNRKPSDATSPSGFRQTLLKSSALFRALAAVVTAIAALGSGVHLIIAPVREELSQLTSKWKWLFFGSAFITSLMVVLSLRFYFCLREINTERRRQGIRSFIITCVSMAIVELAVAGVAFRDSRLNIVVGDSLERQQSSEWMSLLIVSCLCLLLVVLEVITIIIALTCVRSQLYEQIATAKVSSDVVEFERRPSSFGGVEDMDFSIEKIDDGSSKAGDAEKQPLRRSAGEISSRNATGATLVNNELYDVPQPAVKRPKQIPPPLPPVKYEETEIDSPPPLPTSPVPDEVDHPGCKRSSSFRRYERRPRGGTPGTSPIFPPYEDTVFTYYNPQLGTFLRPYNSPEGNVESAEQQQAS